MKTNFSILIFLLVLIFSSCETEKLAPEFSVSVNPLQVNSLIKDTIVVNVNQPIEFQISGNPDIITFFSGEFAHEYVKRNRIKAEGKPQLDFIYNSRQVRSTSTMDVLVSTDFSGINDSLSIKSATWTTLTPPDMKAYINTDLPKVISTIDLSTYATTPIYIAYRLVIISSGLYNTPTFYGFQVRNLVDGNLYTVVGDFNGAGMSFLTLSKNSFWKANLQTYPITPTSPGGATTAISAGVISGNSLWKLNSNSLTVNATRFWELNPPFSTTDGLKHELWAITKQITLDGVLPDTGISAKNLFEPVSNYKYTYTKTGVYTVTFVASNTDRTGVVGSIVKELIIKVQ